MNSLEWSNDHGVYDSNLLNEKFDQGCVPKTTIDYIDTAPRSYGKIYPADCELPTVNPLVVQWRQPLDRDKNIPWSFTLIRSGDVVISEQSPQPHLQIKNSLAPGTYSWSVSYTTTNGTLRQSDRRTFVMPSSVSAVSLPTPEQIKTAAAARLHPRIIPEGVTREQIVSRNTAGDLSTPYNWVTNYVRTTVINQPVPTAPVMRQKEDFPSVYDYNQWLMSLARDAEDERQIIEQLSFVAMALDDSAVRSYAVSRLMALSSWDPSGSTSNTSQSAANRAALLGLAIGYDGLYTFLTPEQRTDLISVIKNRTEQMMPLMDDIHGYPYNSVGQTNVHYLFSTLLLVTGADGFPEAATYLEKVYDTFLVTGNIFGGSDGSFGNSLNYAWYYADLVDILAFTRLVTGYELARFPYFGKYIDFLLAFTAPVDNKLHNAFGDGLEVSSLYQWYGPSTLRAYALLTSSPAREWYWRYKPSNVAFSGYIKPVNFLLVGAGVQSATPAPPSESSWFFRDSGLAAFHDNTADPERSSLFFKSSPLGSFNHSQADQNSFSLVWEGTDMLINSGYYPYYLSPHHSLTRATRYKNALTFDGGFGQAEVYNSPTPTDPALAIEASGSLIGGGDTGEVAFATGDATDAYRTFTNRNGVVNGQLLSNAIRSVAYFKDAEAFVVYDWATSDTARQWELNYHALSPFTLNGNIASMTHDGESICIQHVMNPFFLSTWTGFEIEPEKTLPDQYHLRAAVNTKTTEFVALAVIREDCTLPLDVGIEGTAVSVSFGSVKLQFDKKKISTVVITPTAQSVTNRSSSSGGGGGGGKPKPKGPTTQATSTVNQGTAITTTPTSNSNSQTISTSPAFTQPLFVGSQDSEVLKLQQFLINQGFLASDSATGLYGQATEAAVKRYQCARNIVCGGTGASTGYGLVGNATRIKLNLDWSSVMGVTTPTTSIAVLLQQLAMLQEMLRQLQGR